MVVGDAVSRRAAAVDGDWGSETRSGNGSGVHCRGIGWLTRVVAFLCRWSVCFHAVASIGFRV